MIEAQERYEKSAKKKDDFSSQIRLLGGTPHIQTYTLIDINEVMFCKATVLVLGTLATNRIVLYVAMRFVKGTLWKDTMNGQFCMMKNQTSLLNISEDISSANYLNERKKDLQKENASRISLWAFAGFWTLFQFHLCFSSIRKR